MDMNASCAFLKLMSVDSALHISLCLQQARWQELVHQGICRSGQTRQRSLAAPKAVGLDPHPLKHADEHITHRRVVVFVKR